jgi:hypothetical protein
MCDSTAAQCASLIQKTSDGSLEAPEGQKNVVRCIQKVTIACNPLFVRPLDVAAERPAAEETWLSTLAQILLTMEVVQRTTENQSRKQNSNVGNYVTVS